MLLKLPAEVVARYGHTIKAIDWASQSTASLAVLFPDGGFRDTDRIECTGSVIRPETMGAANRLRAFAEALPQVPKPTAEEIEAVLKRRNPES